MYMKANARFVHVLKGTKRTGRVSALSLAFSSLGFVEEFAERLMGILAVQVQVFGSFELRSGPVDRPDRLILFHQGCDEASLDALLKVVANELSVLIYIEPALPEREMGTDIKDLTFRVDPEHDEPSN
jgi:hypothetical protein